MGDPKPLPAAKDLLEKRKAGPIIRVIYQPLGLSYLSFTS